VGRDLIANIPMKTVSRDNTIARTGLFKNTLNIISHFRFDLFHLDEESRDHDPAFGPLE
jgi:hypothetical protein